MKPLISVIVPARNAEATIGDTLRSIASQQFESVEVIVVNDCSTDSTAATVLRAAETIPGLRLVDLPQHGGYARGLIAGIAEARGNYMICCDADDSFRPGALASLAGKAEATDADMVIAPYIEVRGSKERKISPHPFASLNDMPLDTVHFALWNKLLRLSLIRHNDCMPDAGLDRWADLAIVARFMTLRPQVATIEEPVYNYFIRTGAGSLTQSRKQLILNDHLAIARSLLDWMEARGVSEDNAEFIDHLKFCAKVKYARLPGRDLRAWRRTFPEINSRILSLRHIPLPYRLLFRLASLLPG